MAAGRRQLAAPAPQVQVLVAAEDDARAPAQAGALLQASREAWGKHQQAFPDINAASVAKLAL